MNQEQLIRSIEQELENLMILDEDLAYQYDCHLYYDYNDDEEPVPIVENFTSQLLEELTHLISQLDNEPVHYQ
jgi:hypothetical protein